VVIPCGPCVKTHDRDERAKAEDDAEDEHVCDVTKRRCGAFAPCPRATNSYGAPAFSPRRGRRARDSARVARGAAGCERTPPRDASSIAAEASGCPGSCLKNGNRPLEDTHGDPRVKPQVVARSHARLPSRKDTRTREGEPVLSCSHQGRITSEAAFARLAGAAPIRASSGQTIRYRLDRAGDRKLNRALHMILVTRKRSHPATIAYIERRLAEGKHGAKKPLPQALPRPQPLPTPRTRTAAARLTNIEASLVHATVFEGSRGRAGRRQRGRARIRRSPRPLPWRRARRQPGSRGEVATRRPP
jgi:Transposase IS116/IS110/IS902 family